MSQLVATILLADGREFKIHQEVEVQPSPWGDNPYSSEVFYWTEGNLGCDCNRHLYINNEYGLDLPEECGVLTQLTSLTIDGKEIL